jgi:hypothetical protein
MFSLGFAIVVTSLRFRDTTGRVKNRGGCERLPFEPSGNHRLEKGDRPSPANPKSLQPHTLYIPGKSKTDKRKSGGMEETAGTINRSNVLPDESFFRLV